jgi:RNA polymerase sigma factor (sigma-70 family)
MVSNFFSHGCDLLASPRILGGMAPLAGTCVDPQLLRSAAAGDSAAQGELYRQLSPAVFALIRRLVADRAAAEDLFQDSLLAVLEHLPDFRGEAPLGAWVRRIVLSRCFMHLRSPWQRARLALIETDDTEDGERGTPPSAPAAPSVDVAAQMDLARALARLPLATRAVVWLHDVEGLTHEEIAQGFGRSLSFSKSQLSRAHAALEAMLRDPEDSSCPTLASPLRSLR